MLKIYMAYDEEPQEGAILVFAHSTSEAFAPTVSMNETQNSNARLNILI